MCSIINLGISYIAPLRDLQVACSRRRYYETRLQTKVETDLSTKQHLEAKLQEWDLFTVSTLARISLAAIATAFIIGMQQTIPLVTLLGSGSLYLLSGPSMLLSLGAILIYQAAALLVHAVSAPIFVLIGCSICVFLGLLYIDSYRGQNVREIGILERRYLTPAPDGFMLSAELEARIRVPSDSGQSLKESGLVEIPKEISSTSNTS